MESAIRVTGINELSAALDATVLASQVASRRIVTRQALLVATEAKKAFRPFPGGKRISQGPKHPGRIYYSYAPPFQAAPPLVTRRSGALQTSIGKILAVTTVGYGAKAVMGTPLKYAPYVEYGTSRMAKEPFMEAALKKSEAEMQGIAEEEWAKALEAR